MKISIVLCAISIIAIASGETKQCSRVFDDFSAKRSYSLKRRDTLLRELDDFITKGTYKRDLREEFESDFTAWFELMMKCYSVPEIVTALEKQYGDEITFLAQRLANASVFKPSLRKVKTIGIVYAKMYDGGVEKVISLLIPAYIKMGYSVVLILNKTNPEKEYPIPSSVKKIIVPCDFSQGRAFALNRALVENSVDVVVHHGASSRRLLYDIIVTKSLGIPFTVMRHELATQDMVRAHYQWRYNYYYLIYRLIDKLILLNTMDETFFKLMGCSVTLVHNPIEFKSVENDYNKNKGYVFWLGRMDIFQKNYLDPVKIMKRVVAKHPDARMVMLGGTRWGALHLLLDIKLSGLGKNIEWVPYTTSVAEYYRGAKIHLLTSSFETSPMVVAESRSYGIPLVTYDMPYLEILKDGKGYIAVEQDNIKAAADAVLRLLNNKTLCEELSNEAKESIREFGKFNLEQEWRDIFDELEHERKPRPNASEKERDMQIFVSSMFLHYSKHFFMIEKIVFFVIKGVVVLVSMILLTLSVVVIAKWLWKKSKAQKQKLV